MTASVGSGNVVGEVLVEIRGRMDRYERDLLSARQQTAKATRDMQSGFDILRNRIDGAHSGILALRGAITLITSSALAAFVKNMAAVGSEISDTSEQLGIGIEALQNYRFAAGLLGVSTGELDQSLRIFNRGLGDTSGQVTEFQKSLGQLGLAQEDLSSIKLEDSLRIVSDRLSMLADQNQKAALAMDIFGRTGTRALNVLAAGAAKFDENDKLAKKLGVIISKDTINKADELGDEFDKMGAAARAAGVNFSVHFLPVVTNIREIFTSPAFQAGINTVGQELSKAVAYLVDNRQAIVEATGAISGAFLGAKVGRIAGPTGSIVGAMVGGAAGYVSAQKAMKSATDDTTEAIDRQYSQGFSESSAWIEGRTQDLAILRYEEEKLAKAIEETGKQLTDEGDDEISDKYDKMFKARVALRNEIKALDAEIQQFKKNAEAASSAIAEAPKQPLRISITEGMRFPEIDKAIQDLRFKRAVMVDEFEGITDGYAELLRGLNMKGFKDQDYFNMLSAGADNLKGKFAELHTAQAQFIGAQVWRETRTDVENYNDEMDRLVRLLQLGAISQDTFNRKASMLQFPGLTAAIRDAQDLQYQIDNFSVDQIDSLSDSVADFVTGTKSASEAFKDFANQLINDVARMVTRMLILQAIGAAVGAFAPTAAPTFGGGMSVGGIGSGGTPFPLGHTGGIAGQLGSRRVTSPRAFDNAPRYHSGGVAGLAPDEVPSILRKGEEVLTRGNPRHRYNGGGGTSVVVNINNNSNSQVSAEESSGPGGGRMIDVYIEDKVGAAISRRGSPVNRSLRSTFGARETVMAR